MSWDSPARGVSKLNEIARALCERFAMGIPRSRSSPSGEIGRSSCVGEPRQSDGALEPYYPSEGSRARRGMGTGANAFL